MVQRPPKSQTSRAPKAKKNRQLEKNAARRTHTQRPKKKDETKLSPSIKAPQAFSVFIRRLGTQILQAVLVFDQPADRCVSEHLKGIGQLHARDRSIIRSAIFTFLRERRLIDFWCSKNIYHSQRRFDVALFLNLDPSRVPAFFAPEEIEEIKSAMEKPVSEPDLEHNMPPWLFERLQAQWGDAALVLAKSLNLTAPLDLRANRLLGNRENLAKELADRGVSVSLTPYAPDGLRLEIKSSLEKLPLFEQGFFEVQDEASQLVAHLVAPRRGDWVLDFCAGAGGKTLAMGALMQNRGQIIAIDTSSVRLKRLHPRLARSGLSNIQTLWVENEMDDRLNKYLARFDRVLVDAPCTGLGTLRRNPDLKWRQNELSLKELVVKQEAILRRAADFVKPGGVLVYATCSILQEENQIQAQHFLAQHPMFEMIPVETILAKQGINGLTSDQPWLQMTPYQNQTDGFFGVVFQKK